MSGVGSRRSVFLERFQTGASGCSPRYGWHGVWTYGAASEWVVELCEAAELLGTSERHSRRPCKRYEAADAEGPDRSGASARLEADRRGGEIRLTVAH
jgi:hypothetical protein